MACRCLKDSFAASRTGTDFSQIDLYDDSLAGILVKSPRKVETFNIIIGKDEVPSK